MVGTEHAFPHQRLLGHLDCLVVPTDAIVNVSKGTHAPECLSVVGTELGFASHQCLLSELDCLGVLIGSKVHPRMGNVQKAPRGYNDGMSRTAPIASLVWKPVPCTEKFRRSTVAGLGVEITREVRFSGAPV